MVRKSFEIAPGVTVWRHWAAVVVLAGGFVSPAVAQQGQQGQSLYEMQQAQTGQQVRNYSQQGLASGQPAAAGQPGAGSAGVGQQVQLSGADLVRIGKRIWENEAAGKVEGLTSWNSGEDFASLGIGHFIWYPAGEDGPFEESFPKLIAFFRQNGVQVPQWLLTTEDCPWPNREAFLREKNSERQRELRELLSRTVKEQTEFIIARLDAAAPRFQQAAGHFSRQVAANMRQLRRTAAGNFAMIDYVNFKGEGLKPEERYNGQGWGLLQVLMEMRPVTNAAEAPRAFADASKAVLRRRVENSPPARNEKKWLQGWLNRCERYAEAF